MLHTPQNTGISQAKLCMLKQPEGATLPAEQLSPNYWEQKGRGHQEEQA